MPTPDKSLWKLLYSKLSTVITSDIIGKELARAPQNARSGVAWMHNAFFALVTAKFGSTEAFLAHLLNKAGPNKKGFLFVSKQLAECAKIAEKLMPDCDTATKSLPPALLMMRLYARMKDWWTVDNTQSMRSQLLMDFLKSVVYIALDCPPNSTKKVLTDRSFDRTVSITYLGASGLYLRLSISKICDFAKLFDNPFVKQKPELPDFTESAWSVFAAALTPAEIGFFVKFLSLLIGLLHNCQQKNECAGREVPDFDALARLDDTMGIIEKFIPEGEALDELALCMTAADTEMQAFRINDNKKLQTWVKSLANAHVRAIKQLDEKDSRILQTILIDLADCSHALFRNKTDKELIERGADVFIGEPLVVPAFDWISEVKTRLADRQTSLKFESH